MLLILLFLTTVRTTCCYYRQHYHNAWCNSNPDLNCVLSKALIGGVPPNIYCSNDNGCMPPMEYQGYWLEGFRSSCSEC